MVQSNNNNRWKGKTNENMELIIKILDENKNVLLSEVFDGRAFYEAPFVFLANELGLYEIPKDALLSSLESLEKRLNLVLDNDIKNELLESEDLSDNDKELLNLINNKNLQLIHPKYFYNLIKNIEYGNFEDIRNFIEDNKNIYNNSYRISIECK